MGKHSEMFTITSDSFLKVAVSAVAVNEPFWSLSSVAEKGVEFCSDKACVVEQSLPMTRPVVKEQGLDLMRPVADLREENNNILFNYKTE